MKFDERFSAMPIARLAPTVILLLHSIWIVGASQEWLCHIYTHRVPAATYFVLAHAIDGGQPEMAVPRGHVM
jgi:hypothetical protein